MNTFIRRVIVLLVLASTLLACSTSLTGRRQLMLVSEQQAISASKQQYVQAMSKLQSEGKLVTDKKLLKRVNTITGKLVAQALLIRPETKAWEWSVEIIDDPKTINAWCMAGGRMALFTGLLLKIDPTDDELAQVMGHEISHALANHTAERMSVAMASQLGVLVASSATKNPNSTAQMAGMAAALAVTLPNSRASETEADRIGIEIAAKAGYDPRAAATLWQKMAKAGGGGPPQFMSTHPAPGNRQATLAALAPQMMGFYQAPGERPVYQLRSRTSVPTGGAAPPSSGTRPTTGR
jgi:predicted Zn-dependent protease